MLNENQAAVQVDLNPVKMLKSKDVYGFNSARTSLHVKTSLARLRTNFSEQGCIDLPDLLLDGAFNVSFFDISQGGAGVPSCLGLSGLLPPGKGQEPVFSAGDLIIDICTTVDLSLPFALFGPAIACFPTRRVPGLRSAGVLFAWRLHPWQFAEVSGRMRGI